MRVLSSWIAATGDSATVYEDSHGTIHLVECSAEGDVIPAWSPATRVSAESLLRESGFVTVDEDDARQAEHIAGEGRMP